MQTRTLNDLKDKFLNIENCDLNTVLYTVDNDENNDELSFGVTTIYPGDINGELFMTKGHKHKDDSAEVYYCISGKGCILVNDDIITMEPGKSCYIPSNATHRAINSGDEPFRFFCVYSSDAGHDYNVEFSKRVFKNEK